MSTFTLISGFATDTLKGLTAPEKFLLPRYFYDEAGSRIFQKIMHMPEYYLTDCEMEIFSDQAGHIADIISSGKSFFNLVELGPGDGLKSKILLQALLNEKHDFTYIPVDISSDALSGLVKELNDEMPYLSTKEMAGDYFQIMENLHPTIGSRKLILFLGSNIGNFFPKELDVFLKKLSSITVSGDMVLIGFDLKKSPSVLLKAYDDPQGFTRDFNLNHLVRINNELGADFNLDNFLHHAIYNPVTCSMESYLISKTEQEVYVEALDLSIAFMAWESIFMEMSRKFGINEIDNLALRYGFEVLQNFTDKKNYFTDSLWVRK